MSLEEMEQRKAPSGEVTLVGLGRLGLRTALDLMQTHRGGPRKITAIDGQTVSPDDLIFRMLGAEVGSYKTDLLEKLAGPGYSREIVGIPRYVSPETLDLAGGDVVCIAIAGGDTLPTTASIIRHAQSIGASTLSTMGVFGLVDADVGAVWIDEADPENPIARTLLEHGVRNHLLVGTGKLIRDWEPVTPHVLDRVARLMSSEILRLLEMRK